MLEGQGWCQGARKGRVEGAGGPGLGSGSQDGWCRGCCRVREPGRVVKNVLEASMSLEGQGGDQGVNIMTKI